MTSDEFSAALKRLGWSASDVSRNTGLHVNTISKMRRGKLAVPVYLVSFLELSERAKELWDRVNEPGGKDGDQ